MYHTNIYIQYNIFERGYLRVVLETVKNNFRNSNEVLPFVRKSKIHNNYYMFEVKVYIMMQ